MRKLVSVLFVCVVLTASAMADEPIVYPNKGQSLPQQEQDQYDCHQWASKETGVDPVALAEQKLAATPASGKHSGGAGGAARGAGVGAAAGAAEGDAAAGAERGMGIGRMIGVIRAKRQLRQQQSTDASASEALQAQLGKYDRAYSACLTGRGYTVK